MNFLVTGSSGLVGRLVVASLQARGDAVTRLIRDGSTATGSLPWQTNSIPSDLSRWEGQDVVIHLAGESIATGRWTRAKRDLIYSSRVVSTRMIADALAQLSRPPRVLVCASAVGFYGNRADETLTEASPAGKGFLAEVCQAWESAADAARQRGIRVVHLRFGMILSAHGGALPKILTPFRLGGGGIIGNGRQYWSWITLDDAVRAILFAVEQDELAGPLNVVSPQPITNREFTKTLGRVLRRPSVLPLPAFAARLALGGMADELLLASSRAVPAKLTAAGFQFKHPQLEDSFHAVLD